MCGIAGMIAGHAWRGSEHRRRLVAMDEAQRHRGPDGQGVREGEWYALAHRRLAIIDPALGAQPIANETADVWVVFNGEIYNHADLRRELAAVGHRFATSADTEVLVHGWEQWGLGLLDRLRGMFAFALVDERDGSALLARDHLGIKPLCYRVDADGLWFASELAALERSRIGRPRYSLRAVDEFLAYQYIPAPASIWTDVAKVPPGHYLRLERGRPPGAPSRYWDAVVEARRGREEPIGASGLDEIIGQAVVRHHMSDVSYGTFLSGGIDSFVVAQKSLVHDGSRRTYAMGFDAASYDESRWAAASAAQLGSEHHCRVLRSADVDQALLERVLAAYGEPFGDASALPTWALSSFAVETDKVVLSGDGGDELFAGYGSYAAWLSFVARPPRNALKRMLYPLAHRIAPWRYPSAHPGRPDLANWSAFTQVIPREIRASLWLRRLPVQPVRASRAHTAHWSRPDLPDDPLLRARLSDLLTYLPDSILVKVDIAAMAHGLEVRPPLLDLDVVHMALRMPATSLIADVPGHGVQGKVPLKSMVAQAVGPAFAYRTKQGFSLPAARLMAVLGADDPERLCRGPLTELFDPGAIRRLLLQGREYATWNLVVLDAWMRRTGAGAADFAP